MVCKDTLDSLALASCVHYPEVPTHVNLVLLAGPFLITLGFSAWQAGGVQANRRARPHDSHK